LRLIRRSGCLMGGELMVPVLSFWHNIAAGDILLTCASYSAGGVIILNGTGKIDINNTFEERLKLLESDALPFVRTTLFGENENRRFKD